MKMLLRNIVVISINFFVILLVWAIHWLFIWLFTLKIGDSLANKLPKDSEQITAQPYLFFLLLVLGCLLLMMVVDDILRLVKEKSIFKIIGDYYQHKKRPPS